MMKPLVRMFLVAGLLLAVTAERSAAQREETTIRYLKAAVSSLPKNSTVTVTGEFMLTPGLREVQDVFLRSKGISRFSIRDPQTGDIFDGMYCAHDSPAFKDLLTARSRRLYRFTAYRDRGESRTEGVFVTRVELVRELRDDEDPLPAVTPAEGPGMPGRFRVTLIEQASSNRSVLFNVEPGTAYTLNGFTIVIERE